jgi:thiamine biosynthesis protein ThiS
MTEITITLNGERRAFAKQESLTGLLDHLSLDPRAVVVELNRSIVRRGDLASTTLADGDVVELVHFVGGG